MANSQANSNDAQLITIGDNGRPYNVRGRELSPRDVGFNGKYGDNSSIGLVRHVMQVAQPCSNGQLCMTNSALLWFQRS